MRTALAIASFVVLVVHGIVFYNQFFHKWENYQTAYFDQALALARTPAEKAALAGRKPRIEQAIVTSFGDTRVDRCGTCHIAMDDPRFKDHAQPLRTHPFLAALGDRERNGKWERRHKFSDFGCTVCHDGQGRGLKQDYSHGVDEYWPEPLLGYVVQEGWRKDFRTHLAGKQYMQANCAQCHTEENFAGTPLVEQGRRLFFKTNCYGCHRLAGLSEGTLGPDLTEAGRKFKVDYLWESIVDPTANLATSFMPKFNLSENDVKALVIFLKSRRGMNFTETSLERYRTSLNARVETASLKTPAALPAAAASRGRQLIEDRACTACHKLGGKDGGVAPDLSYEGSERDDGWIFDQFENPRARVPDSIMPSFRFSQDDFRAMSAYLAGLRTPVPPAAPAETYKALCRRCHGEKGDGKGTIARYLDPYPRDLSKPGFLNSKSAGRLKLSLQNGVPGTSMPPWKNVLTEAQIDGLLDYVQMAFVKDPRRPLKPLKAPDVNPVGMSAESAARGGATFLKRCAGCHGRKADGKGPNSLDILPRPRNLRNTPFVSSVSDRRLFESILYGVQGTAMPAWIDYGLSQNDVGDLVNFIRNSNINKPSRTLHARTN